MVATKVFGRIGPGPNGAGASRGHILDAVKASLKRLQLDHIDLYQIHGTDPLTPVEETLEALDLLVRQGLVRYVGVSNWAAWQVAKAQGIAERRGLARIALAAGLLHHRRARPRARDRADADVRGRRADGLEPARRRPALGQVRRRRRRRPTGGGRASTSRRSTAAGCRACSTRCAASPTAHGATRRAGGARLAAAPAGGDERDHRRQAPRPARRQPRRRRRSR